MSPLQPAFLQSTFEWLEALPVSEMIRNSTWIYAVDQILHLVGLAVFLGAVLVVDFRLLGRGPSRQPLAQVGREAQPWLILGFVVLVLTGIPQLISTATKEFYSPMFWFKMYALIAATLFTFTLRHRVVRTDEARLGPVWPKVVALISMGLWLAVIIPARLIGLLS